MSGALGGYYFEAKLERKIYKFFLDLHSISPEKSIPTKVLEDKFPYPLKIKRIIKSNVIVRVGDRVYLNVSRALKHHYRRLVSNIIATFALASLLIILPATIPSNVKTILSLTAIISGILPSIALEWPTISMLRGYLENQKIQN